MMKERLSSIQLYWRAANYISCVLLYLCENVLLQEKLRPEHFKKNVVGHWGTCPGINAIIAHLYSKVTELQINLRLVVGTGHAGTALAANLFLDGSFNGISSEYAVNEAGLKMLTNNFGTSHGFDTEISPEYPGVQYCGGELGGALAFGQGYVLNDAKSIVACIIGDGELETALTQSAWQGFRILSEIDGIVLPIINANGFRMGSRSLFSLLKQGDINNFFSSHNLHPYWATDHYSLALALDSVFTEILSPIKNSLHPLIIFQSPKGWSAPDELGGEKYVNTFRSHKPILRNPSSSFVELEQVENWLSSYQPETLFDRNGSILNEVTEILPETDYRFGSENDLHEKNSQSLYSHSSVEYHFTKSSVDALCDRLSSLMLQEEYKDILIFSPDELLSNRFGKILENTTLRYCQQYNEFVPPFSPDGRVIEVLNEQLCFGWMQGYCASGRRGIFICYEAFAPICDSQVAQLLKYIKRKKAKQRSVNVILTSLGWENNPSHQNPGFIDALLGRQLDNLRVYTPTFGSDAACVLGKCLNSYNMLNIIVVGKHRYNRLSCITSPREYNSWLKLADGCNHYPALVAIGDGMAEQCLIASDCFHEEIGEKVSVYVLNELTLLERSTSLERQAFIESLQQHSAVIWAYLGYPASIRAMLWGVVSSEKHIILGYNDKGLSRSGQERYDENCVGSHHICSTLRKYVP